MHLVQDFLEQNIQKEKTYLLGYSGGPDSKALLHILLESNISLHVAHIDHGWREESRREADLIEKEMRSLNLPFHRVRLNGLPVRDVENTAREERLKFFTKIVHKHSLEGVFLAQHQDDLAETILKRLFEGSHFLSGMKPVHTIHSLRIFRPFLSVSKDQILVFLREKNLSYFQDPTNQEEKYLRARMRHSLIPHLSRTFGKDVRENLALLSERSRELENYLDEEVHEFEKKALRGPWGIAFEIPSIPRILLRHLILRLSRQCECTFSRTPLENLLDWIEERKSGKKIILQKKILLYQNWLFFLEPFEPDFPDRMEIKEGEFKTRNVHIKIRKTKKFGTSSNWKDLFQGKAIYYLPQQKMTLSFSNGYQKKLSKNRIPSFLRSLPVFQKNNQVLLDLVSEKKLATNSCYYIVVYLDY